LDRSIGCGVAYSGVVWRLLQWVAYVTSAGCGWNVGVRLGYLGKLEAENRTESNSPGKTPSAVSSMLQGRYKKANLTVKDAVFRNLASPASLALSMSN
jgi:hypothetical protein